MRLPWDSKDSNHAGTYNRPRSASPYHTNRWTRLSSAFRSEPAHALCAQCLKEGKYVTASVVDHIKPWPICGLDGFYDRKNLQALCEKCNHAKGQRDKKLIQEWRKTHPQNK